MASKMIETALRALQLLWTILIMALVGNMINEARNGNHSAVNYAMFVSVFSLLSLFYLIPATFRESLVIHPMIKVALDVINAILFFIGGVVLAAKLEVHSCGNDDYIKNNPITNGGDNMNKRCHEAQAVTAFLWFGFIAYLASAILSAIASRSGASLRSGGIRRGGPAMSHV